MRGRKEEPQRWCDDGGGGGGGRVMHDEEDEEQLEEDQVQEFRDHAFKALQLLHVSAGLLAQEVATAPAGR